MRVAYFDVTPDLLAEFVFASAHRGGLPRVFFVKKNPLPADTTVVHVRGSERNHCVRVYVESASFDEVSELDNALELPPIWYETVYGKDYNEVTEKLTDAAVLSADYLDEFR